MITTIKNYFSEAQAELKKVTWPSQQELVRLTAIVVIISATVAAYIALLDYIFSGALNLII